MVLNEITQKAYQSHSIARRRKDVKISRQAKCKTPANCTRCECRGCIHSHFLRDERWLRSCCVPFRQSHVYILRLGGPAPVNVRLFSPLYFKSGLECTTQSFGLAQTWITYIKIQKWMDVKSEATAEKRMLAQRAQKVRVTVAC